MFIIFTFEQLADTPIRISELIASMHEYQVIYVFSPISEAQELPVFWEMAEKTVNFAICLKYHQTNKGARRGSILGQHFHFG